MINCRNNLAEFIRLKIILDLTTLEYHQATLVIPRLVLHRRQVTMHGGNSAKLSIKLLHLESSHYSDCSFQNLHVRRARIIKLIPSYVEWVFRNGTGAKVLHDMAFITILTNLNLITPIDSKTNNVIFDTFNYEKGKIK